MSNFARPYHKRGKRWMAAKCQHVEEWVKGRQPTWLAQMKRVKTNKSYDPLSKHYGGHRPSIFLWEKKSTSWAMPQEFLLLELKRGWRISPHPIFHPGKDRGQNKTFPSREFQTSGFVWAQFRERITTAVHSQHCGGRPGREAFLPGHR